MKENFLNDPSQILKSIQGQKAARPELSTEFVPPRTPEEKTLSELCSDLLNVDRVGMDDSLMELGANSIHFAQLSARVSDTFKVELPFRAIFDSPTVAALAKMIKEGATE